jgi:hypothetical protein
MKIIIYLSATPTNGTEVRFRASTKPVFHILESNGFLTLEDALDYAETFQRGCETAGAETVLALDEMIADMNDTLNAGLPTYPQAMKSQAFDTAWEHFQ